MVSTFKYYSEIISQITIFELGSEEAFSLFPVVTMISWITFFLRNMRRTLRTRLRGLRNAPRNYAVSSLPWLSQQQHTEPTSCGYSDVTMTDSIHTMLKSLKHVKPNSTFTIDVKCSIQFQNQKIHFQYSSWEWLGMGA